MMHKPFVVTTGAELPTEAGVLADVVLQCYPSAQPVASVLLLHGAGAPVQSEFFQQLLPALHSVGLQCYTANFAYMRQTLAGQRKVAPKAVRLLPELAAMVTAVRQHSPLHLPLWLVGKSLGGRVASLYVASAEADVTAIAGAVVLGYPLCPPAKAKDRQQQQAVSLERTSHFANLRRPLYLAQGSRDAFGSAEQLSAYLTVPSAAVLLPQPGADHDFNVRRQDPYRRAELFARLSRQIDWQTAAG